MSEVALQVYTKAAENAGWGYINSNVDVEKLVYDAAVGALEYSVQSRLYDPSFQRRLDAGDASFYWYLGLAIGLVGAPWAHSWTEFGGVNKPIAIAMFIGGVGTGVGISIYEWRLTSGVRKEVMGEGGTQHVTPHRQGLVNALYRECGLEKMGRPASVGVSWSQGGAGKPDFIFPVWAKNQGE